MAPVQGPSRGLGREWCLRVCLTFDRSWSNPVEGDGNVLLPQDGMQIATWLKATNMDRMRILEK